MIKLSSASFPRFLCDFFVPLGPPERLNLGLPAAAVLVLCNPLEMERPILRVRQRSVGFVTIETCEDTVEEKCQLVVSLRSTSGRLRPRQPRPGDVGAGY